MMKDNIQKIGLDIKEKMEKHYSFLLTCAGVAMVWLALAFTLAECLLLSRTSDKSADEKVVKYNGAETEKSATLQDCESAKPLQSPPSYNDLEGKADNEYHLQEPEKNGDSTAML